MILDQLLWEDVTVGDLLAFILVIVFTVLLGHLAYALIRRSLQDWMSKSSARAFARLMEYAIIILGLYFAFWQVPGMDVTGVLVSLGIVGIALAFVSQQIVQNAFAGILFTVSRPLLKSRS